MQPSLIRCTAAQTKPLFTYIFERRPRPINVTTLTPTKIHANDHAHPFHARVTRRLSAFDSDKLYWRIHVPIGVSKLPAVRRWVMKRVREALRLELTTHGFKWDGSPQKTGHSGLRGALLVIVPSDGRMTLSLSHQDIKSNVKMVLRKVVEAQDRTA